MTENTTESYEGTVLAWADHLRAGGRTPWTDWREAGHDTADTTGRDIPGAAQLEVVRRLAERAAARGGSPDPAFGALADTVLARSGPGRGLADSPLTWPRAGAAAAGPPAVDPSEIDVADLVRICLGVLADYTAAVDIGSLAGARRRRRRWGTGKFHLAGPPVSAARLRGSLTERGRSEGGRKPTVVLLAGNLDDMMSEVWTARVQRGSEGSWHRFTTTCHGQDRLPLSADLSVIAKHWAERVGRDQVHVVVYSRGEEAELRRVVAEVLRVDELRAPTRPTDLSPLRPASVEVLRRLNGVLAIKLHPEQHRTLIREWVVPRLLSGGRAGRRLLVPEDVADWSYRRSVRLAEDLAAGGYVVHGDLGRLVTRRDGKAVSSPGPRRVLEVAMDACLRAAETGP